MLVRRTSTCLLLNFRSCRCPRTAYVGGVLPIHVRAASLKFSTSRRVNRDTPLGSPKPVKVNQALPATDAKAQRSATSGESFKQDALLAEKVVTNVEQRKADWAIMKEMTKYLWPKVYLSLHHLFLLLLLTKWIGQSWCKISCWSISRLTG
jgi:hypothetical protein